MENKIGQDFKSIQPDFTNVAPNNTFEGAVYSGGGGLFASDRRANNVGDIITVTLEENITAANSGNETFTKSDSYEFDLPEALFGPSSLIGKLLFPGGVIEDRLKGGTTQKFTGTGTAGQNNSMNGPKVSFIVSAILSAWEKSAWCKFRTILSFSRKVFSTSLSTVAPPGILPTVGVPWIVLEPSAPSIPRPPTTRLPWAIPYTSPSAPLSAGAIIGLGILVLVAFFATQKLKKIPVSKIFSSSKWLFTILASYFLYYGIHELIE